MISDLVRLDKVLNEGGWWLDLDIELFKPMDKLFRFGEKMLIGYMYDCAIGTAMFYAPKGHPYIRALLDRYRNLVRRKMVSNSVFTEYFVNEVPGFLLTGEEWDAPECHVFRKEMFEQPSFPWTGGMAMHHCAGAWMGKDGRTDFLCNATFPKLARIIKWGKRQIRTTIACKKNEFRSVYLAARKGRSLRFDPNIYYKMGVMQP